MKTLLVGLAIATLSATSAFAEFYIIQHPMDKRCSIAEPHARQGAGIVMGQQRRVGGRLGADIAC